MISFPFAIYTYFSNAVTTTCSSHSLTIDAPPRWRFLATVYTTSCFTVGARAPTVKNFIPSVYAKVGRKL